MHIPTYHLRSLLVVLVILCSGPANTRAQQDPTTGRKPVSGDSVTIRPTVGSSKRGVPVEVVVDKTKVRIREKVSFTLVPKNRVANPRFTVNFGDGNEIQTNRTRLEHHYERVGHYDVFAWITPDRTTDPDSTSQDVPSVSLSATPTDTSPGGAVTFVAQLSSSYPGIKYRFVFGDKETTGWLDSAQTEHPYTSENTYYAYVEIGVGSVRAAKKIGRSRNVQIQVRQQALRTVDLIANPNPAEAGKSVDFTAVVVPQVSNIVYRFSFGDGSATTGWQASAHTTYTYPTARSYPASVDIGTATGGIVKLMGSAREAVRVTLQIPPPTPTPTPTPPATPSPSPTSSPTPSPSPSVSPSATPSASASPSTVPPFLSTTPSPSDRGNGPWDLPFQREDWWKYLLIALALAGGVYWGWKVLFPPRTSFAARPDPGGADVYTGSQPLAIESQVILNPDVSEGQYLVYTEEPSIVRSVRRDNG
jgi:hypothetical protein